MTAVDRLTNVWDRLLTPPDGELTAEHARYVLRLGFTPADDERMTALGAKANEGTLDPDERAELQSFVLVGHLLARLHSLARMALRRAGDRG